tara:strand:- start:12 stop:203 length:192 start_codon:yes stop_codon:yes gene_type:complete
MIPLESRRRGDSGGGGGERVAGSVEDGEGGLVMVGVKVFSRWLKASATVAATAADTAIVFTLM